MKTIAVIAAFLLSTVLSTYGQWSKTYLTEHKYKMGAAMLGNKAYFGGGAVLVDNVATDKVEIYDLETGAWSMSHLSNARQYSSGVTSGSKVFFAGGMMNFGTHFSTVDIYDTITRQWTVEHLSVPRFDMGAVSKGNKVLFAGGANLALNLVYNVVDIYNTETGTWSTATLSQARSSMGSAVAGDLAIFAGGFDNVSFTNRVDMYNFTTNTWSTASLSQARGFATATVLGNKVFIAGGITASTIRSDRVDIYDVSTGIWTTASLSAARGFIASASTTCGKAFFVGGGNFSIVIGGVSDVFAESNVIDIYDEATNSWSTDNSTRGMVFHSVLSAGNQLIIAGGEGPTPAGYQVHNLVEIYTCHTGACFPRGNTFSSQADIDQFPTNHPTCTLIDGDVIINGAGITNLYGLGQLTTIGGNLNISGCSSLASLTGLSALTSVGGYLLVSGNDLLTSLTGIETLTYLGGDLSIDSNPALQSINALENISLNPVNGLYILSNSKLNSCGVRSICDYLVSPDGYIEIHDNAGGCNSQSEVEAACKPGSVDAIPQEDDFILFPNPVEKMLRISSRLTAPVEEVVIYNQVGQKVLRTKPVNNSVDVSKLKPGVYILEVVTSQWKNRKKLIIL